MVSEKFDLTFVLPGFPLHKSGGHTIIFELARMSKLDGFNVRLVFVKDVYKEIAHLISDEKIVNYIKQRSFLHLIYNKVINTQIGIKFLIKILRHIMRIKYSEDIDGLNVEFVRNFGKFEINSKILISASYLTSVILGSVSIPKETSLYNFIQNQEDNPDMTGDLWSLARKSYEYPMKLIVINKREYERFVLNHPIFLPIGINSKFALKKRPEDRNPRTVLFFLSKSNYKGAKYAIEAINLLHEVDKSIEVYSFGNYSGIDIPKNLKHLGMISDSDLVDLYNACSVFVLPSLVEGVPAPGLEAMACGCALISTLNGGVDEYVIDGVNGILVPIKDSNSIVHAVIELVKNDERRVSIAHNGTETAKNYDYKHMYSAFKREVLNANLSQFKN